MAARKNLTPEDIEEIIGRIAYAKASVATACEGVCEPATFWRHLSDPGPDGERLRDSYARATDARANVRFESIDGVLGSLLAGKIDAHTARVMVDTIKWQCGREKPKRYGEKLDVKASVVIKSPKDMSAEELREWAQELGEESNEKESSRHEE
jgi:hypothetical protein